MGTVFSLYKRRPKERYELGKHFHGFRPGREPRGKLLDRVMSLAKFIHVLMIDKPIDREKVNRLHIERLALTDPGWTAMWSIMDTPDYSVFKMSRWTREELADKLYCGSQNIDTLEQALIVADHILEWAGDADITLNPEEEGDLAELGWPTRGYRLTGRLWDRL